MFLKETSLIDKYKYFLNFIEYIMKHRHSLFVDFIRCKEMNRLLNEENIITFFQPIVSLKNGATIGFEVFNRPPQSRYFPTTESFYDYIGQSQYVLFAEHYIRKLSLERFADRVSKLGDKKNYLIFLNIHPKVITDPSFHSGKTLKMLQKYGISPKQIILELTERESTIDYKQFERLLIHYRSQGFRIAIDDVGTGYNSLKTVVHLKPEYIKLDKSLIKNIDRNPAQQQMVRLLFDFAFQSGTEVIAEGIEQVEEIRYLQKLGMHLGQGYAIGKPLQELKKGFLILPKKEEMIF